MFARILFEEICWVVEKSSYFEGWLPFGETQVDVREVKKLEAFLLLYWW